MHARSLVTALTICAAAMLAASASAATSQAPSAETASNYLEPLTFSPSCTSDLQRRSACRLVRSFFRAVNSRNFHRACGLLGRRLRSDWRGVTCEASLDGMVLAPVPWGILDAQLVRKGASVLLIVGQPELERIWMRKHRAYIAHEDGQLRILETRLVS